MTTRSSLTAFFSLTCMLLQACAAHIPLPEAYKVDDAYGLVQRMQSGRVAARAYSGELRLSYFGPAGRFKGTASLIVARPDKFRYELQGPHGGVLVAAACDGQVLSTLDLRDGKFNQVKAEPHNLDQLLGLMPLGMKASGWVQLLFGEVPIPQNATLHYDDRDGMYVLSWEDGPRRMDVRVAPATGRVTAATVFQGNDVVSSVRILMRTQEGLPESMELRVPGQQAELEVRLRDVALEPPIVAGAFTVQPQTKL